MSRNSMSHGMAVGLLPDFVADELEEITASAMREHVERCPQCREWVEMYRLLERTLGEGSFPVEEHPDSALLALCVLRPEEELEIDRTDLREHLGACGVCQKDIEILREAVREARPGRLRPKWRPRVRRQKSRNADAPGVRSGLLAAGLSAAAVGLAVYLLLIAGPASGPLRPGDSASGVPTDPVAEIEATPTEEVSGLELEDSRVIEAERSLMVTNVKIKAGARVTFRAGEVAAFGDGFQISDGGAIVVEVRKPSSQMKHRRGAS